MATPKTSPLEIRLEFAVEIARQAGEQTLAGFRKTELTVERKSDGSPVTAVDRAAEELLRDRIAERFPEDAILGEEFGETPGRSSYRWVLDPIDGTKTFICGVPLYTTLVAVMQDDAPLIGVVFAPAGDEMVYAARGLGCWHVVAQSKPRRARVSTVDQLAEAVFLTTAVRSFSTERGTDARLLYDRMQDACRITRTWGDAYGYLLVATGRAEIMIDPALSLWDAAALQPIIEEAGGRFCDWLGRATVHSEEAIATNALLAGQVSAIMQEQGES